MKEKLNMDLQSAIFSQDISQVISLVQQGAELNPTEYTWNSPLSHAVQISASLEFIQALINLGAGTNPSNTGNPPLAAAVQTNYDGSKDAIIDFLISQGAEVNPESNQVLVTPLMAAVQSNNPTAVKKFIDLGADANPRNESLVETPFTVAMSIGHPEILPLIFEKTDFTKQLPAKCVTTYMMLPFRHGRDEVMEKLLNIDGIDIFSPDSTGDTPLYLAIVQQRFPVAKKLFEMGARLLQQHYNMTTTNPEILELVKSYQPEANVQMFGNYMNNLQVVIQETHIQPEQPLITPFVEPVQTPEESPHQILINAIWGKDIESVKAVVAKEGVSVINNFNNPPALIHAIDSTNMMDINKAKGVEILDYLLDIKGIDLNITNISGDSPLSRAIMSQNQSATEKLIKLGADKVTFPQYTSLHQNRTAINYYYANSEKAQNLIRLIEQEKIDNSIVIEALRSLIADGDRHALQAAVEKGGQALMQVLHSSGEFKQFKKDFTKIGIKFSAKYHTDTHDFIISSTFHRDEYSQHLDKANTKENSKTFFKDGKIHLSKTGEVIENLNNVKYVISKTGVLYVDFNYSNSGAHSCFLKGKPSQEDGLYGYGKPVASGGWINIEKGKLTKLDGSSGHYAPTPDQIKVVANYLKQQGVLAENPEITWYDQDAGQGMFNDISDGMIGQILDKYALVEY